jgi:hypothetical protein
MITVPEGWKGIRTELDGAQVEGGDIAQVEISLSPEAVGTESQAFVDVQLFTQPDSMVRYRELEDIAALREQTVIEVEYAGARVSGLVRRWGGDAVDVLPLEVDILLEGSRSQLVVVTAALSEYPPSVKDTEHDRAVIEGTLEWLGLSTRQPAE